MTDPIAPRRPGLPLDPLLQLWAGAVVRLPDVVLSGGLADRLCGADPMRVALFLQCANGASPFAVAPSPGPVIVSAGVSQTPAPTVIHCRDYPGVTQGEWVVSGMVGATVAVWSYTLADQWG